MSFNSQTPWANTPPWRCWTWWRINIRTITGAIADQLDTWTIPYLLHHQANHHYYSMMQQGNIAPACRHHHCFHLKRLWIFSSQAKLIHHLQMIPYILRTLLWDKIAAKLDNCLTLQSHLQTKNLHATYTENCCHMLRWYIYIYIERETTYEKYVQCDLICNV